MFEMLVNAGVPAGWKTMQSKGKRATELNQGHQSSETAACLPAGGGKL